MTKPTTTQRGYGWEHQKERARWAALVKAGGVRCARCGRYIEPEEPFDLGHVDGTNKTVIAGAEHRRCNRATAAHRKARSTSKMRPTSRDW